MAIRIENGDIYSGSIKVGTANKDLKHGYHPAIVVEMNDGNHKWFEMDESDLLAKIADYAREHI
jgi:hypothetical protein